MITALLIEDDASALDDLATLVRAEGIDVETARTLEEAKGVLERLAPDIILTDLMLPDGSGLEIFEALRQEAETGVVLITGHASVDTAVEALRRGAADYLTKPVSIPRLRAILANLLRTHEMREQIGSLREELRSLGRFGPLVGRSKAMQNVYDLIARVAGTEAAVLVTGESGTGKELVAQAIHEFSPRHRKPFVAVNCAAIATSLIESELFGHAAGSFTGAAKTHQGYFERAHGGTLLLDEIGEMPMGLQVKLLRVLETGRVMRVGGSSEIEIDVRVVSATNASLTSLVASGSFREDLFYRLNVFPIEVPPLRAREDDVIVLAHTFLERLNRQSGSTKAFTPAAEGLLTAHDWAGNVRELKNAVQRAFILAEARIEPAHFPIGGAPIRAAENGKLVLPLGSSIADAERQLILSTLDDVGGDKKRACQVLGISLKTLYARLKLYDAQKASGANR